MVNKGGAGNLNRENFMKIDLEVYTMAMLNKRNATHTFNQLGTYFE